MKKFISSLVFLLIFLNLSSQDTVRITHNEYITVFSKTLRYPVLVEWWDTKIRVDCSNPLPRKDRFAFDPYLPIETNLMKDYVNSGYDRGHMCPAADNRCSGIFSMEECFYFSNMTPQTHSLNAGLWKSVEVMTRELSVKNDSVHIWCGSIGELKKIGTISVPTKCWKIIYIVKTKEWLCFLFDNINNLTKELSNYKTTKEQIEKLTGFKFTR